MDDKSLPYNLQLRKDHEEKAGDQEVRGGHLVVNYGCEKCGCSVDLETSLRSHHCKNNKNEKEAMEMEVEERLGENKSFRKRSRKGIPTRPPFF